MSASKVGDAAQIMKHGSKEHGHRSQAAGGPDFQMVPAQGGFWLRILYLVQLQGAHTSQGSSALRPCNVQAREAGEEPGFNSFKDADVCFMAWRKI